MSETILYAVSYWEDYAGGGIVAVFSTLENAKKYYDNQIPDSVTSYDLITIQVDNANFKGEQIHYKTKNYSI